MGDILLLPKNFFVEFFDRLVLQSRKRFELDDSFFHKGGRIANRRRKESGFSRFCIEVFDEPLVEIFQRVEGDAFAVTKNGVFANDGIQLRLS